jgi:hypothetical protein
MAHGNLAGDLRLQKDQKDHAFPLVALVFSGSIAVC